MPSKQVCDGSLARTAVETTKQTEKHGRRTDACSPAVCRFEGMDGTEETCDLRICGWERCAVRDAASHDPKYNRKLFHVISLNVDTNTESFAAIFFEKK